MSYFGQSIENESFNTLVPIERFYPDLAPNTVSNATSESSSEPLFQGTRILYWYHPDYVSNVDLVTDVNGEAYELFLYNAWGESLHHWTSNSSNGWSSPYRFNSKELDPETGMHYYGARYHHPKLSVWMSVDPLAHETFEPYQYTSNNPISCIDPDGEEVIAVTAEAQQNILNTLRPEDRKYVKFNKNGKLKVRRLRKAKTDSKNFDALKTLSMSNTVYKFAVQESYTTESNSEPVPLVSSEENGVKGVTLIPGAAVEPSPDGAVWVITSKHLSPEDQASNTAHEGYGHAYFYELQLQGQDVNPYHDYGYSEIDDPEELPIDEETGMPMLPPMIDRNSELDAQIKAVELEARENYQNGIQQ